MGNNSGMWSNVLSPIADVFGKVVDGATQVIKQKETAKVAQEESTKAHATLQMLAMLGVAAMLGFAMLRRAR